MTARNIQSAKPLVHALVIAGSLMLVVLASAPHSVSAHRRFGSCDYSSCYPRRYDYHRSNCSPRRSYHYRPRYNTAMDILDDLILTTTNTLARQRHRSRRDATVSKEKKSSRYYSIEDFGSRGLELTIEVPGLSARDLDLEIIERDGNSNSNSILVVRGNPVTRHGKYSTVVTKSGFSQSFELSDDSIDLEGIRAHVSSGILRITLPRIQHNERRRNDEDRVPIVLSNRDTRYVAAKRLDKLPVVVARIADDGSDLSSPIPSHDGKHSNDDDDDDDDDLFISEEEDVW